MTSIEALEARIDGLERRVATYNQWFSRLPVPLSVADVSAVERRLLALLTNVSGDPADWLRAHPAEASAALTEMRVLELNSAAQALLGAGSMGELQVRLGELVDGESFEVVVGLLGMVARGETWYEVETSRVFLDGTRRNVIMQFVAARGGPSSCGQLLFLARDVTAQRAAEAERARLAAAVDHVSELICLTDVEGRIGYVNGAFEKATGHARANAFGRGLDELIFCDVHPPEFYAEIYRSVAAGSEWTGRLRAKTADGTMFPASTTLSPMRAAGGPVTHLVAVLRDLTAELELEDRMRRKQKLEGLGVMAGGIAHDFNNLLMGVLGNADIVLSDLPDDHPARASLEAIAELSMRGARLTNQMLAYAGQGRYSIEPLDLDPLVSSMGHLLRAAVSRRTELRYELAPGLPGVNGDGDQLRQVVMNLVLNAAEAIGDEPGSVRVVTGVADVDRAELARCYIDEGLAAGRYVFLDVIDTGAGMDADTIKRIFDPFYTTRFAGRGLGLASVLGTVRSHNGTVRVESVRRVGTCIRVYLPSLGEAVRTQSTPPVRAADLQGLTLLVVDDDENVRRLTKRALERAGAEVLAAENGAVALEIFEAHAESLHAVLLDWRMPVLDGADVLRRLRDAGSSLPVLLTSGLGEREIDTALGADPRVAFIQKPYRSQDLVARLAELIGG